MSCFVKKRRKLLTLNLWFVGLLVSHVPSILCYTDRLRPLTFENIYNNTNYAQLQHPSRPYDVSVAYNLIKNHTNAANTPKYSLQDETKDNELEYEEYSDSIDNKNQLLVGFSHDPFKYSIPEKDYSKGIREIDPNEMLNKGERGKRGVVHLYNMLYCATGCDPISYKGYGCYCGFLGAGRPTDGIDRCCQMHDRCYENIYCPLYTVYFQPYYWRCYHGEPQCALENYHTQHNFINGCAARLCECDRLFAMCVRRYHCPRRRALCYSSPLRLLQNVLMFK